MNRIHFFSRRAVLPLLLLWGLLLAASGCRQPESSSGAASARRVPADADAATSAAATTAPELAGAQPVPAATESPRRVISLSPNITESVFAMGAQDLLVGVTDFCRYPPEARAIQSCGGWSNPNYEVISRLQPDLILILGEHVKVREFASGRGIRLLSVTMDGRDTILGGIRQIGAVLGRAEAARALVRRIDADLAGIARELAADPRAKTPPRVFISVERKAGSLNGMYSAGAGSFLGDALRLAGGANILADVRQPYPQVSKESLIARHPDAILELTTLNQLSSQERRQLISDWQLMPSIPAVKNGRIHILTDECLLIPGPRLPQVVRTIKNALYPPAAR
ncbi:MAG: helical backbone metal receptor [bacterium]|nr:helical backbone metal receptor [bacterium]